MSKHPHVAVMGDLHAPFHSVPTVKQFIHYVRTEEPTHVIQMGDMYDFYAFSRFPGPRILTPEEEVRLGRKFADEFWDAVRQAAPGARRIQLVGNHDVRPAKRMQEKAPELSAMFSIEKCMSFRGVHTHWGDLLENHGSIEMDATTPFVLDNVNYIHGAKSKLGQYVTNYKEHYVVGHLHRAGTHYIEFEDVYAWEHNCGYGGDPQAKCFSYAPKPRGWTLGHSAIRNDVPTFFPLR